jgi:predicted acetyltransferase
MSSPSVSVVKIGPESELVLQSLFDEYVRDMARWFAIDSYDVSSIWAKGYDAYLAKVGDSLAGFALIGSADELHGTTGAHDVGEFFVTRSFRRNGIGEGMATVLWDERPGEWLVRVLEANAGAVVFWRTAITKYSGGSYAEECRLVKGRPWRFFRFTAKRAI